MAKDSKNVVQISSSTSVDHGTGEVRSESREQVLRLPQEPPYVKMYLDDLGAVLGVPAGPRDLLYHLVRKLDYDGFISLTPGARERICDAADIKRQTLANYLNTLCKSGILKHRGRGEYEMNPQYFARGDWKDICQRRADFVMQVKYRADGTKEVTGRASSEQLDLEDVISQKSGS